MLSAILMGAWATVCAYVSFLFQDLLLIPIKYNFTEKKKVFILKTLHALIVESIFL